MFLAKWIRHIIFWCRNPGEMSEQDLRGSAKAAGVADDEHQREMERTKRKRGTIRGATTRLVHQIDSEMAKPDLDTDHLSTLLEMLSAKLVCLR